MYLPPAYEKPCDPRHPYRSCAAFEHSGVRGIAYESTLAGPEVGHQHGTIDQQQCGCSRLSGDAEAALARMKTRYKNMVDSKYTTRAEGYCGGAYDHGWAGGPLTLMMQYVAGVAPTSAGFAVYQVKPQLGGLTNVNAGFKTVKGRIEVEIVRRPENFHLNPTSPEQTTATVCIPLTQLGLKTNQVQVRGQTLWKNGKAVSQIKGVTTVMEVAGQACFAVAPRNLEVRSPLIDKAINYESSQIHP